MNDLIKSKELVSVKELASILNVGQTTIKESVTYFTKSDGYSTEFGEVVRNNQGGYMLNELQCTAIKNRIQGHHNLKDTDTIKTVKTDLDGAILVKQAMDYLNNRIVALEKENIEMKPKADFYDAVAGSDTLIDMSQVAKVLNKGLGRNNLFDFLRSKNVLMHNNNPYQSYIDNGWFKIIEVKFQKPNGDTQITLKTMVFQKGVDGIRKLLEKKS